MAQVPLLFGFPLFTTQKTETSIKNQKLRISDIWALWEYIIMKRTNLRSSTRHFLQTLLEQAQYFYETAVAAPIKSQPLLYYYSFLNFAKIIIAIKNRYDETLSYQHGIETQVDSTTNFTNAEISIKQLNPRSKISVAKFFCDAMGDTFPAYPMKLKIADCMRACVAIHRTYCEIFKENEMYYRLDNIKLEKSGKNLIYKAVVHKCNDNIQRQLNALGYNINKKNGEFHFQESYTMPNYNVTRDSYYNFSQTLKNKGLWYYISGDDFRTYVSTDTNTRYSMEAMIYCVMFFFGSVTRYHPYFFDSILNKEQKWMVSEFLNTLPKQFLYLTTSKATGITVLKSRTANL